jgi:hypothetical protein
MTVLGLNGANLISYQLRLGELMFEKLFSAPPDEILELMQAFRNDPRPNKIDLGVGVYKDHNGYTPIMNAMKKNYGNLSPPKVMLGSPEMLNFIE